MKLHADPSAIPLHSFHDVYLLALTAADAERAIAEAKAELTKLVADQTSQKRELKNRQAQRQGAKRAAIASYLAKQGRYAERGQVDPRTNQLPEIQLVEVRAKGKLVNLNAAQTDVA